MKIRRRCRGSAQYHLDHRIVRDRTGHEATMQFDPPRPEHRDVAAFPNAIDGRAVDHD
jgi:hypothetical protein